MTVSRGASFKSAVKSTLKQIGSVSQRDTGVLAQQKALYASKHAGCGVLSGWTGGMRVVPRTGIEPVRRLSLAADFKSAVSTNFTTRATFVEAGAGIEPA